jgi:hypothetical protein
MRPRSEAANPEHLQTSKSFPMRRYSASSEPAPISTQPRNDWQTIVSLLPYLATYKWRVTFALPA